MTAATPDALAVALQRGVRGRVLVEPAARERHATDFGGAMRRTPRVVVYATCEADVVHAVVTTRAAGVSLTVRGAGHSCAGQTLTDGVLLVNRADEPRAELLPGGVVRVDARATWNALEAWLQRANRTSPVLTDYLDLTVGGTLSVGGHGVRSVRHGAQVDQVRRLRLVCSDGTAVWCGPDDERFALALGGLGCVGILEAVEMRTLPRPEHTLMEVFAHVDLEDMLDSMAWLAETRSPPSHFGAHLSRQGRYTEYGGPFAHPDARRRPARRATTPDHALIVHLNRVSWLARQRGRRHLWADFQLPFAGFATLMRHIETLRAPAMRWLDVRYVLATRRRRRRFPFVSTNPEAPMTFGAGLYFSPPPDEAAEVHAILADLLAACIDLGGRPYLYGACPPDADQARRLYGPALERVAALRRAEEPDGLLRCGLPFMDR